MKDILSYKLPSSGWNKFITLSIKGIHNNVILRMNESYLGIFIYTEEP
jgi:hypothetical protein